MRGDGILIIRLTSITNWPINVSSITTVQMEKENYNRRGFLSPGAFSWGGAVWPSFRWSLSCSQVSVMKSHPVLLTLNLRPDRPAFMIYRTRAIAASLAAKSLHTSNGLATAAKRSLSRCVNNRRTVCNAAQWHGGEITAPVGRPGWMELLGLEFNDLCVLRTRLIQCSARGTAEQRPEFQLSRCGLPTTING